LLARRRVRGGGLLGGRLAQPQPFVRKKEEGLVLNDRAAEPPPKSFCRSAGFGRRIATLTRKNGLPCYALHSMLENDYCAGTWCVETAGEAVGFPVFQRFYTIRPLTVHLLIAVWKSAFGTKAGFSDLRFS
jgi:hypothetical protein